MKKSGKFTISAIDSFSLETIEVEPVIMGKNSSIQTLKTTIMAHIGFWFDTEEIDSIHWDEDCVYVEARLTANVIFKNHQVLLIGINEEE